MAAAKIKKDLKRAPANVLTNAKLYELLVSVQEDLAEVKAKFDAHKHSFDGTQAADSITSTPKTGATTGSANGGTASSISIGTTKE